MPHGLQWGLGFDKFQFEVIACILFILYDFLHSPGNTLNYSFFCWLFALNNGNIWHRICWNLGSIISPQHLSTDLFFSTAKPNSSAALTPGDCPLWLGVLAGLTFSSDGVIYMTPPLHLRKGWQLWLDGELERLWLKHIFDLWIWGKFLLILHILQVAYHHNDGNHGEGSILLITSLKVYKNYQYWGMVKKFLWESGIYCPKT